MIRHYHVASDSETELRPNFFQQPDENVAVFFQAQLRLALEAITVNQVQLPLSINRLATLRHRQQCMPWVPVAAGNRINSSFSYE